MEDLLHGYDHMIDLGAGEGSVHGQAEDSLVGVLRDWAETGSGSEPLAIKRMEVHRNVMHVHPKPSLPEHREDGRSVPLELLQSEAYDIQMICVLDIGRNSKGSDCVEASERLAVSTGNGPTTQKPLRELPELTQAECALDVCDSVVEPEVYHLIEPRTLFRSAPVIRGDSVIAKAYHRLGELSVRGCDHAAFAGRDLLCGMEAEGCQVRECPDPTSFVRPAECVSRIGD